MKNLKFILMMIVTVLVTVSCRKDKIHGVEDTISEFVEIVEKPTNLPVFNFEDGETELLFGSGETKLKFIIVSQGFNRDDMNYFRYLAQLDTELLVSSPPFSYMIDEISVFAVYTLTDLKVGRIGTETEDDVMDFKLANEITFNDVGEIHHGQRGMYRIIRTKGMIRNVAKYGVAFMLHNVIPNVVLHELGHTVGTLKDELPRADIADDRLDQFIQWVKVSAPNLDDVSNEGNYKWQEFINHPEIADIGAFSESLVNNYDGIMRASEKSIMYQGYDDTTVFDTYQQFLIINRVRETLFFVEPLTIDQFINLKNGVLVNVFDSFGKSPINSKSNVDNLIDFKCNIK